MNLLLLRQGRSQNPGHPGPGPGISGVAGHQATRVIKVRVESTVIVSTIVTTYSVSTSRQPEPDEQKCVSPRGFHAIHG